MGRTSQVALMSQQLAAWQTQKAALKEFWDLSDEGKEQDEAKKAYKKFLCTNSTTSEDKVTQQEPTATICDGDAAKKILDMSETEHTQVNAEVMLTQQHTSELVMMPCKPI